MLALSRTPSEGGVPGFVFTPCSCCVNDVSSQIETVQLGARYRFPFL